MNLTYIKILLPVLLLCTVATSNAQWLPQPVRTSGTTLTKGDGSGGFVAAIAGTDFATVAQATHSGGVIGAANFKAGGGFVSDLVNDGVITGVEYCETGKYTINLSGQVDADYIVVASLGGDGSDNNWTYNIAAKDKGTASFTLIVRVDGSKSDESDNVQVAVMRLSQ